VPRKLPEFAEVARNNDHYAVQGHSRSQSATSDVQFGVPQGSVLGPLLFVLYTADIVNIIACQGLSAHQYADDIQVYGRWRKNDATSLCLELGCCTEQVADWMNINRLQLMLSYRLAFYCDIV